MIADLSDILWMREMPHRDLVMAAAYHLPGAAILAAAAVMLRMLLEEVLKHLNDRLARAKFWSIACFLLWIWVLLGTTASDQIARTIYWDRIVSPPAAPGAAPAQR